MANGKVLSKNWHRDEERSSNMNVRLKDHERAAIQKKADEFCGGKISVWLRYCALTMQKPRAADLVPETKVVNE